MRLCQRAVEIDPGLGLDPDGYEVNAAAARCYIAMRRYAEAIGCLEKAAAAIETDFWALGMVLQCYEAIGDVDGLRSAARRGLDRVENPVRDDPRYRALVERAERRLAG